MPTTSNEATPLAAIDRFYAGFNLRMPQTIWPRHALGSRRPADANASDQNSTLLEFFSK